MAENNKYAGYFARAIRKDPHYWGPRAEKQEAEAKRGLAAAETSMVILGAVTLPAFGAGGLPGAALADQHSRQIAGARRVIDITKTAYQHK